MNELKLNSLRARKARLSRIFGKRSHLLLLIVVTAAAALGGLALLLSPSYQRFAFFSLALAVFGSMLLLWYFFGLKSLPAAVSPKSLDELLEAGLLASFGRQQPRSILDLWEAALSRWQARFILSHCLLDIQTIAQNLSTEKSGLEQIWLRAQELTTRSQSSELDAGQLMTAILLEAGSLKSYLGSINMNAADILEVYTWGHRLSEAINRPNPHFGGIGRDWAAGYTPTLDSFGQNISRLIERGGCHFYSLAHSEVLDGLVHGLSHGSGAVALVGEAGTGKSSLAFALAERLLEGRDQSLSYYQIVSLNAAQILSAHSTNLENIILQLFGEAAHAGNIIILLDDAQLFFGKGTGALDVSQIMMPLLQNRSIKVICLFTPNDFEHLKISNSALSAEMAVTKINEPSDELVMSILEDTALTLEQRDRLVVSFEGIREAYRLSGQYSQDLAYPGKAIKLLELATAYAQGQFLTAGSVQSAIEKMLGIKVAKVEAVEADRLLHLEDLIHKRMINQSRAVSVIASALRRGRAGVANPKRPIGSFLFLGPTGVGKTELARSLAAVYFGAEKHIIRLDMSEYQQQSDIARLLENGTTSDRGLIMSIRQQPFSVVLFDEIEKAHPSILNLLLQLLDEGQLTDQAGKPASFKNSIIIITSNAGSADITQRLASGGELDDFERPLIDKLINQGSFKPELMNRFDEVVLFRPLNEKELAQVAQLMIGELNETLAKQNVRVELSDEAIAQVVANGFDPQFGARPMRRAIQKMVEDTVASRILSGQAKPGDTIMLGARDLGGQRSV